MRTAESYLLQVLKGTFLLSSKIGVRIEEGTLEKCSLHPWHRAGYLIAIIIVIVIIIIIHRWFSCKTALKGHLQSRMLEFSGLVTGR